MEELDWLVTGYLKEQFLNADDYQYPESLTAVFIQFLGNIFLKFDVFYPMHEKCVQDDGKILKFGYGQLTDEHSFGCSYPFISGIYNITIKWVGRYITDDPICICSDTKPCEQAEDWIWRNLDLYTYGIYHCNLVQSHAATEYQR